MEQLYYIAKLYDLYGGLLREKQRACLRLHIAEDLSLAEIGEELGITRQAAHESIRLARQQAQEYALGEICAELRTLEEPIARAVVHRIAERLAPYASQDEETKEVRE